LGEIIKFQLPLPLIGKMNKNDGCTHTCLAIGTLVVFFFPGMAGLFQAFGLWLGRSAKNGSREKKIE